MYKRQDQVLGDTVPKHTRAELATLIYYPNEKLPQLKARCTSEEALDQWYTCLLYTSCPQCGASVRALSAEEFAFNSQGACRTCSGTGMVMTVDESTLVPVSYTHLFPAASWSSRSD